MSGYEQSPEPKECNWCTTQTYTKTILTMAATSSSSGHESRSAPRLCIMSIGSSSSTKGSPRSRKTKPKTTVFPKFT